MKKAALFFLVVLCVFSLSACISNEKSDLGLNNAPSFTEGDYLIEFNEDLLGDEYKTAGNEIKGCDYKLSFKNGKFTVDMNFGNSVGGTYSVSGDGVVLCSLKTAEGEYSPEQNIKGEISFKVVSGSKIKILSAPDSYDIKITELKNGEWVLTSEEKSLGLWPLVNGIEFKLSK